MEKAINYELHYSYIEILENELAVVSQLVTKKVTLTARSPSGG